MRTIGHLIGGAEVVDVAGRFAPVWNPATGEQQARVALASPEQVRAAVGAARAAAPGWRAAPLGRRAEVMFRFRDLLDAGRKEVARLLTAEHGKTLDDALGEIARGLENVEFACGAPHLLRGGYSEQVSAGVDVHEVRQPLGVVAGITPFNFPAMVPLWMLANALVCGNAFVLKPSERDPSPALFLAELLGRAGLPAGVLNVVQGDKVAVDALLDHPDVAAVSFVGSTPIARYVYERATAAGKRVQALGGAKNHLVVLPDAEIAAAADAAVSAAYGSAGERCMAVSVVVAVGEVADPLVEAIATRVRGIRVGPGYDDASEMGPLITAAHRGRVAGYLDLATAQGASVVVDGRADPATSGPGFFLGPSLVDHVRPTSAVYTDEIFGPVLAVVRVATYDEALRLIEDNPYGNGAAIFTRDGGAARRFTTEVQAGMVGVNVPIPVPVAYYSFGGWKGSLFGDLHMYGPDGIRFYTRTKVVTSRWPDPATSSVDLGFPRTR
ncbi:CoA-acylating methylmalonate-semialdehyde dehydrogenase [Frankia tisae]|uniref:CoA-acylating methylmalonate-semialdehyde dehydrogenase n=1 Tax=Frankia tisae TaxID=2950104 RepID=UPI0021BDF7C0|nr:CoA-acylating methylmalonate-semialdehyde dehydrogenase [Frankia tisae]